MTRASLAVVAIALSTGCAHTVSVDSSPPGAEVFIEGERVGTTPMQLTATTDELESETWEVRYQGRAKRFAVERDGFALEPIGAGVLAGVGSFLGGAVLFGVGTGLYVVSFVALVTTLGNPAAAGGQLVPMAMVGGSAVLYAVGVIAMSIAPQVPIIAIGHFGRRLPERVHVDLRSGQVRTDPPDKATTLYGRPEGARALVE